MSQWLHYHIGGVPQNDYSITKGGYAQMITILHRGEGSLGTPKSDYVICAGPLMTLEVQGEHRHSVLLQDWKCNIFWLLSFAELSAISHYIGSECFCAGNRVKFYDNVAFIIEYEIGHSSHNQQLLRWNSRSHTFSYCLSFCPSSAWVREETGYKKRQTRSSTIVNGGRMAEKVMGLVQQNLQRLKIARWLTIQPALE